MGIAKYPLSLLSAIGVFSLVAVQGAHAFHSGGAGECEGCHTIHNSSRGAAMSINGQPAGFANANLLLGSDPSSTCLNCHQRSGDLGPTTYHVSTPEVEMPTGFPPKQLSPGGDFGWLKKNYNWLPAAGQPVAYSFGERHGHNVVSRDYGFNQDVTNAAAPGGAYPSATLSCISCHDPHGRYRRNLDGSVTTGGRPIAASGSFATSPEPGASYSVGVYRMLGGSGYYTSSAGKGLSFIANPPVAVAPLQANRSEAQSVTRVGYGTGVTEWCKNCHTNMHDSTFAGNLTHSSGVALSPTIINNYNSYLKTGSVAGSEDTAYSSLVPFEVGTMNYPQLKGIVLNTPTRGPEIADGTPAVMCLSCHRAHASGWDEAVRWNSKTDYLEYGGYYSQQGQIYQPYGQGRTEAEALAAYYGMPQGTFAPMQKSLCNKCHVNDLN